MLGSGQGKTLINVRIFWGKSVVLRNAGLPRKCLFFFLGGALDCASGAGP